MGKNKKNTLLWQIDGIDLPGTSYLFGTMHVKDRRAFQYTDIVYQKIDACTTFATEFNLEELAMNFDPTSMFLPDSQTLDQLLPPKVYRKLEKIFRKSVGIELQQYNRRLPMLVSSIVSESILSKDMPHSLDEHLWTYARSKEKITLGLETYLEQVEILNKIPIKHQLKALIEVGKNFKRHRKSLLKMTHMYERSDIRQLHKAGTKNAGGLKKLLIFDRNRLMAERMQNFMSEQTIFCAIGAGHLAGKKGVLRLLKQQGFKVKPVKAR